MSRLVNKKTTQKDDNDYFLTLIKIHSKEDERERFEALTWKESEILLLIFYC